MGLFEKNWDDLTGKSIVVDDIEFTWDENEELPPDDDSVEKPDEAPQERPQTQKEEKNAGR